MTGSFTPGICGGGSRASRILPLGFGQQPIVTTGLFTEPFRVVNRVAPRDADGGMIVILRESEVAPRCSGVGIPGFAVRSGRQPTPGAAADSLPGRRCDERCPLSARHIELAGGKTPNVHL